MRLRKYLKGIGTVLAVQMVFSSAAGAMTLSEFKTLSEEKQNKVAIQLIMNQLASRKQTNPSQIQCLNDQFFKTSTNALGVPDGVVFVGMQVQKSYEKDPDGRHIEDVVKFAMNQIANKVCPATEQTTNADDKRK